MADRKFPDVWVDPEDDPREGGARLADEQLARRSVPELTGHADLLRERIDGRTGQ